MTILSWKFLLALVAVSSSVNIPLCWAQTVAPGAATTTATAVPGATATAAPGTTTAPGTSTTGSTTAAPGSTAQVEVGWGGCIDPTNPDPKGNLVTLGQKTTICIVLSSSVAWNIPPPTPARTLRLSFQPMADEYSRFHVPDSYRDLVVSKATSIFDGTNNVTIHVSSQKVLSFQRMFYTPNNGSGRVFPYLTAIIDVSKGVVKGITWDDACLFCSSDRCLENTYDFNGNMGTQEQYKQATKGCYIESTECVNFLAEGQPRCDIMIYVVWTGDDSNGRALQSSAFRFSAFPPQELQNRIDSNIPDLPFGLDLGIGSDTPDAPQESEAVATTAAPADGAAL